MSDNFKPEVYRYNGKIIGFRDKFPETQESIYINFINKVTIVCSPHGDSVSPIDDYELNEMKQFIQENQEEFEFHDKYPDYVLN